MAHPLMPKATAVWLVENTALTFEQISEFCGLHEMEVQAIADGEVVTGMQGLDPIAGGELTLEELARCDGDPKARLKMAVPGIPLPKVRQKGARYTPVSKRQDRPDAIAWLLRSHPELSDAQVSKLIGTTKPTINAIRERSHWNMPNIKPQNPVNLGLCSGPDLEKVVAVARARMPASDTPPPPPPPKSKAGNEEGKDSVASALAALLPGQSMLIKGLAKKERLEAELAAPPPPPIEGIPETPDVLKAAEEVFAPNPTPKIPEEANTEDPA
ncbi:MAG: DUF1013 domain-containing protein [Rhodospirillales bacterium]|nr:DUF1013 domain-containing protein [Rhodospirillales bacterium]